MSRYIAHYNDSIVSVNEFENGSSKVLYKSVIVCKIFNYVFSKPHHM